ncbi:MAG: hypothetical protein Q9190_003644 [Brigantiaea leucoxantha]
MSFQRFDSPPNTQSKRPHLSIFRFTSFQSNNLRPSMEPPAYSPNDELAAKAQLQAKILKYMRCALAFLTLAISVTVLACSAKSLRSYSETRDNAEWVLPLWPTSVDLRPTRALLSCGVILTVASLLYLVAALVPTPLASLRSLNILSTVMAFLGVFMTIFTTILTSTINSHLESNTDAGTLYTWTCKWQGFESIAPQQFGSICMESTVAMNLVVLLIVLQALSVLVVAWGWWIESRVRRGCGNTKGDGIEI